MVTVCATDGQVSFERLTPHVSVLVSMQGGKDHQEERDRNCKGEKVKPCNRNDTTVGIVIAGPARRRGDPHHTVIGAMAAKLSDAPS